jgi:hypothetical protein
VCSGGTDKRNGSDLGPGSNGDNRANGGELSACVGGSQWTSSTLSTAALLFCEGINLEGHSERVAGFQEFTNVSSEQHLAILRSK